jgi:hypothetical protein
VRHAVPSVTEEHDSQLGAKPGSSLPNGGVSPEGEDDTVEVVDGLPVVANQTRILEHSEPAPLPARQAAALAATGFACGAVTAAVVTRRRAKRSPARRAKKKKGVVGEIVSSNSFLVDVHLLRRD